MHKQNDGFLSSTPYDGQKGFWAAWNRFFYQIEGPAQITRIPGEALRSESDPEAACPICGRALSLHAFDRGGPGEKTFIHCPKD